VGYLKITNLYNQPEMLECFATEKVHGTSAHLRFRNGKVEYFAGGESHEKFVGVFKHIQENMEKVFGETFLGHQDICVYGEAYGGKQQGMGDVYGDSLKFIAFDVKVDGVWLDLLSAEALVKSLGLEFVPYERGPLTLEFLNKQRDRPSLVAVVPNSQREGVVVRPIYEATLNDGSRMIFKHKTANFRETKSVREVELNPEKRALLTEASAVATEYVVPMRLEHVLQKIPYKTMQDTANVIQGMQDDIKTECSQEISWSKEIVSAIAKETVKLLRQRGLKNAH